MTTGVMKHHLQGAFCAIIWGTTFLVSKLLLNSFTPLQIMFMRFLLAYAALWLMCPRMRFNLRDEVGFFFMSLFGNTLYFLSENTALEHTYSTNVSILVSAAPVAAAVLLRLVHPDRKLPKNQLLGIGISFAGVVLVVFNGAFVLHLSPVGDLLSLCAALCWGIYGVILERYTDRYSGTMISRKLMFYGIVCCIPLMLLQGKAFPVAELLRADYLLGILFLGLVGSALCYIAWNKACAGMGIVAANMYIYAIPFVTLLAGAVFYHEPVTVMAVCGALLIAAGMYISAGVKNAKAAKESQQV